ncbi:hypothetical protein GEMRC1_005924 [Eukaryota sp. GEM-RC1]
MDLLFLEKTQQEVAEFYLVSQSTVSRWIVEAFEDKDDKGNTSDLYRGKLQPEDITFIQQVLETDPLLYLREIVSLVKRFCNKTVSISCIHRSLVKIGYSHKRCKMLVKRAKQQLIQNFEVKLAQSVGFILQYQLVFVDEVSLRGEDFVRSCGWSPRGVPISSETKLIEQSQIGTCVAIGRDGYLHSHIKSGHFNRHEFVLFLQDLLRTNILNSCGRTNSIIILDGCRIHNHIDIFEGLRKAGVKYFILPPYCPEQNPIENFFKILKSKLQDYSRHFPGIGEFQLLHYVLYHKMRFDCSKLFKNAGYENYKFYKSPYLVKKELQPFVSPACSPRSTCRRRLRMN